MKKAILLMLGMISACALYGEEFSTAKITAITGVVEVAKVAETGKEQVWLPAKLDMLLSESEDIRTKEGKAELTFEDGSKIRLSDSTSLSLAKMKDKEQKGDALVKLWAGKIRAKFTVQKEKSTFQLQTKNIVAAVKGTDLVLDADFNGGFLEVIEGIVSFIDSLTKKELFVKAGEKASYAGAFQGNPEGMNQEEKDKLEEEWNGKEKKPAGEKKAPEAPVLAPREEVKAPEAPAGEGLGASFGAVSIDGKTYYMMSFLFELSLGKIAAGFDVRLLWNDDGIREDDWKDWQRSLQSMFKYIRYGVKGEPVYLKLGVLDSTSLGHGFLVRRYSNVGIDVYKRTFGLELDVKPGAFGLEGFTNDIMWGRLYAGRFYWDLLPNFLQAGVTGVYDFNPNKDRFKLVGTNKVALPDSGPLVEYGVDIGFSLIKTPLLSVLVYADYALLRDGGEGFAAPGVMGKIAIFDYQLEYRSLQSNFIAGLFDYIYEDRRPINLAALPLGERLKGIFGQLSAAPVSWLTMIMAYEQYEGSKPYVRAEVCYKGRFIPKISEVAVGYEQKDIDTISIKSPNTVAYARVGMEMAPGVIFLFTMRQTYDDAADVFKRSTMMAMQMKF
ncbi:MAG: FecR family protein [Candidatus Firestonebacteria bacterium]|nr:FecR family protein [Candidatus Firestonebacteria bacterium]